MESETLHLVILSLDITLLYPGAKRRVLAPRTYVPPLGREFVDSDGELCF